MLKRTYLVITTVLVVGIVGGIAQIIYSPEVPFSRKVMERATNENKETSATPSNNEDAVPKFNIRIKGEDAAGFTTSHIPIIVTFHNGEERPVKIIDVFSDFATKRMFFSLTLSDENGSPVFTTGIGKVAFAGSMAYVDIKSGDDFNTKLNVADFVPKSIIIKPGEYKVSVIYRNQYGEDYAFKGQLKSNSLALMLN